MRKRLFILFCLINSMLYSQWQECSIADYLALINKNKQILDSKTSFSFECTYQFFENFESVEPSLEYKSIFIKNNSNDFYFEQFGKTTIQNNRLKLIYDSIEKQLVITDKDSMFQDPSLFDASKYSGEKSKIKRLLEKEQTKFYFELPKGQKYQGVEVWVDLKGFMVKMIFYAAYEIEQDQENSKMIRPRMEISFKNYKINSENKNFRKIENFIKIDGETISLLEKYKDFELIDLRKKI